MESRKEKVHYQTIDKSETFYMGIIFPMSDRKVISGLNYNNYQKDVSVFLRSRCVMIMDFTPKRRSKKNQQYGEERFKIV